MIPKVKFLQYIISVIFLKILIRYLFNLKSIFIVFQIVTIFRNSSHHLSYS